MNQMWNFGNFESLETTKTWFSQIAIISLNFEKVCLYFEHCSHERKMCKTCLECKSVTAKNKHPNTKICKTIYRVTKLFVFLWYFMSQNVESMNHSDFYWFHCNKICDLKEKTKLFWELACLLITLSQ